MSIIYEALKKVEGQKEILSPQSTPGSMVFPVDRKEKRVNKEKKIFLLPVVLLLVALVISALPFILPLQKRKVVTSVVDRREIDPARVYRITEPKSQVPEEIILGKEPVQEYILEGIIYDPEAPSALINGRVMNESDNLGNFRIDRISENNVEMINTEDNNKVILSLPN